MTRIAEMIREMKLPSLPRAALRIFQLAQTPDVDFQELTSALEMEPAIAARIVRLSNSSLFGISREVSSVRQALVVLGLRTVKLAIISTTAAMAFPRRHDDHDMVEIWRRILTNASGCRLIAPTFNIDPEEAFLAGMMQDITMLLLVDQLDQDYRHLLEEWRTSNQLQGLVDWEKSVLGTTHAALGAKLLGDWQFPEVLLEAVARHHDFDAVAALKGGNRELPVLMGIAECVTEFLLRPNQLLFERFQSIAECFDESVPAADSVLDKVVQRLETYVSEMADLLELQLPCGQSYQQKMLEFQSASPFADGPHLVDSQSGLLHRDGLLMRLRQELSLAKRHGWSLSVVMISTGTLEKESATEATPMLQRLGEELHESLRGSDLLYRYADNALCLLANNVDTLGVTHLLARVSMVMGSLLPEEGYSSVTFDSDLAAVVALAPIDLLDEESLMGYADRNMLQALKTGAVCVTEVDS